MLGVKVELHQGDNDSMMDSEDFPKTFEGATLKTLKKTVKIVHQTPKKAEEFKELKFANQGRRMSEMNVREI
jgi:hypothetical protein